MFFAIVSTVSRSSSRGTTSFTIPRRCAVCASTQSPVYSICRAFRCPSSHGCAKYSTPGIPQPTTRSRNSASSDAMMMSHTHASIRPPAIVFPCTSAIIGFGMFRHRRHICR